MDAATVVVTLTQIGAGIGPGPMPPLPQSTDWAEIVKLAVKHRVAPLVWQALSAAPAGVAPAPILAELETQACRSSAARMLCEHTLGSLLDTLAARGIEVLVLKGPALAHEYYPWPGLRLYHDLDILCRPGDYPHLADTLLSAGFSSESPIDTPGDAHPYDGSRRRNFIAAAGEMEIEVHLDVLGLGIVERHHDEFWRAARTVDAGSLHMRTLAPAHQLLHLALHVHTHCYSRLLWLIDVDLLIRRHGQTLDWQRVVTLARDEGMAAVLRHVLATAHAMLGTPLPVLPLPTIEERCLGICYRRLWPLARVARLDRREHRRLLRFTPGTGDPRDVVYSLLLLGRRREKWQALHVEAYRPPR